MTDGRYAHDASGDVAGASEPTCSAAGTISSLSTFFKRIPDNAGRAPAPDNGKRRPARECPSTLTNSALSNDSHRARADDIDLFISYAHRDDVSNVVAEIQRGLESEFRKHFRRELNVFFDREHIRDFDDWKVRCYRKLLQAQFFLVCLSPQYLESDACRWEWHEWLKRETQRGDLGMSAACIYLNGVPTLEASRDDSRKADWMQGLQGRFTVDLRPWAASGPAALREQAALTTLRSLTGHVIKRLEKLGQRRNRPGNLSGPPDHFVGRTHELARLHKVLTAEPRDAMVVVHGLDGIGKTSLCQQSSVEYAADFPGGAWQVRCEGHSELAVALTALAIDLGIELTDEENVDVRRAAQRVLKDIRRNGRALIVLDNVDHSALLARDSTALLPSDNTVRVLVTTALAPYSLEELPPGSVFIALDKLSQPDGLELIRRYQPQQAFAGREDESASGDIVELLDGFTLAVETTAIYLGQYAPGVAPPRLVVTPSAYRERLRSDLHGARADATMSQLAEVAATLRRIVEQLKPQTQAVLLLATMLPPEGIVLSWLRSTAQTFFPELGASADIGAADVWSTIARELFGTQILRPGGIGDRSLADAQTGRESVRVASTHRLLQQWLIADLDPALPDLDQAIPTVSALLRGDVPGDGPVDMNDEPEITVIRVAGDPTRTATYFEVLRHRLETHVMTRAAVLEKTWSLPPERWESALLYATAMHWLKRDSLPAVLIALGMKDALLKQARLQEATMLFQTALSVAERHFSSTHSALIGVIRALGEVAILKGEFEQAETLFRRALAIAERRLSPGDAALLPSLNALAAVLMATNRPGEAETLYRRALSVAAAAGIFDHSDLVAPLTNLGELLRMQQRFEEAETLQRRALTIAEATFGPMDPSVGEVVNNLALLLKTSENWDESEQLYRRALEIFKTTFSDDHPAVAGICNNLGALLHAQGRFDEAEPLFRRALVIHETTLGPRHFKVGQDLNNLASLCLVMEQLDEAEACFERARDIQEEAYGAGHPELAKTLSNLGNLYRQRGRFQEAERLFRQSLAIMETSLPPDHVDIATALWHLATILDRTDRAAEALPLLRRAIAVREVTGPEDPVVGDLWGQLGQILFRLQQGDEAEACLRKALNTHKAAHGSLHPDVAMDLNNLASVLQRKNKLSEAEMLFRASIVGFEGCFGPDDHRLALPIGNFSMLLKQSGRFPEAAVMARRHLVLLTKFTKRSGETHPHLYTALAHYSSILEQMGLSAGDVQARAAAAVAEGGLRLSRS